MSIPLWTVLAFACWTLLILLFTVGYYRWSRILTGRSEIKVFKAGEFFDNDPYRRFTRAHANCVENLPVYTAIVLLLHIGNIRGHWLDVLSVAFISARMIQTLVHAGFVETNRTVGIRFSFYFIQLVIMLVFAATIVLAHL